ncbi:MAG: hypothetical protein LBT00_08290 [Spirochaetaceae bacterium]|nr:hypothetical protein [Spirochaetaceae bacterium]
MSSTSVIVHNRAHWPGGNNADLFIRAELVKDKSKISTAYAHSGEDAKLESENLWYDLFVYDAEGEALLVGINGIYGDSKWDFVNDGAGYALRKSEADR